MPKKIPIQNLEHYLYNKLQHRLKEHYGTDTIRKLIRIVVIVLKERPRMFLELYGDLVDENIVFGFLFGNGEMK